MASVTWPTLLLIANDPQLTYLIKRYGEQSGCRVSSASAVDAALRSIEQERPAMVLLHLMSWPHEGWPILRRLKEHDGVGDIPIAIISAIVDEARARDEGATYWLWQPVMYDDFRAALAITGVLPDSALGHERLSEKPPQRQKGHKEP
jgi:DNA-binding response OmpR family regulator